MINRVHFIVGIFGVLMFILTGQYFLYMFDGLENIDIGRRLMYRSCHIYLFYAGLINIILGIYYQPPKRISWTTWYCQSLIMVAPFLLIYSFFFEIEGNDALFRPVGSLGVFLPFGWLVNMAIGKALKLIK